MCLYSLTLLHTQPRTGAAAAAAPWAGQGRPGGPRLLHHHVACSLFPFLAFARRLLPTHPTCMLLASRSLSYGLTSDGSQPLHFLGPSYLHVSASPQLPTPYVSCSSPLHSLPNQC